MIHFQKHTAQMASKWGLSNDVMARYADLVSEIGELGKELVAGTNYGEKSFEPVESSENLAMEMGDIVFALTLLANALKLDMEECFAKTMKKCEIRMADKGHIGS